MESRILIVSKNTKNMQILNYTLSQAGYHACFADDAKSAQRLTMQFQPSIALVDGFVFASKGEQIVQGINNCPHSPVIIATSVSQEESSKWLMQSGCSAIVPQPININHLLDIITAALEK